MGVVIVKEEFDTFRECEAFIAGLQAGVNPDTGGVDWLIDWVDATDVWTVTWWYT